MVRNLRLKHSVSIFLLVFSKFAAAQIDIDVTNATAALYQNLKEIQNSNQFLFGQEFFNSFRYSSGSAHGEMEYSDCKAVTGSHPAVLGSDFHYYLEKDPTERSYHSEAVKWAFKQGYVITFDWHLSGRGTTTYEFKPESQDLINNIINDVNGDRNWFFGEVDKVIDIINKDLLVDDEKIPIVFRPLHEMNGGWFWWGSQATTPTNYVLLYRMLVNYVKERTNTVLFCWSPNAPVNFDYYPGDEYVDVLGVDAYEVNATTVRSNLSMIIDHAQNHDKVAVFSETGYRDNKGTTLGDNARSTYWKNIVLPAIVDDPAQNAHKIAWVLTWINASWSVPYVPHQSSSPEARQSFMDFKNSPFVIFGDEIPAMYSSTPVVGIFEEPDGGIQLVVHPLPVENSMTISLSGFEKIASAEFYDMQGKLAYRLTIDDQKATINTSGLLDSGLYILLVSDSKSVKTKKLFVN
jgi:mannan endo-1,4-beta-mannosidase